VVGCCRLVPHALLTLNSSSIAVQSAQPIIGLPRWPFGNGRQVGHSVFRLLIQSMEPGPHLPFRGSSRGYHTMDCYPHPYPRTERRRPLSKFWCSVQVGSIWLVEECQWGSDQILAVGTHVLRVPATCFPVRGRWSEHTSFTQPFSSTPVALPDSVHCPRPGLRTAACRS